MQGVLRRLPQSSKQTKLFLLPIYCVYICKKLEAQLYIKSGEKVLFSVEIKCQNISDNSILQAFNQKQNTHLSQPTLCAQWLARFSDRKSFLHLLYRMQQHFWHFNSQMKKFISYYISHHKNFSRHGMTKYCRVLGFHL